MCFLRDLPASSCLDDIGVERIDHGVNCLEDDYLLDRLSESGIGLTACPISNSYVTADRDQYLQAIDTYVATSA